MEQENTFKKVIFGMLASILFMVVLIFVWTLISGAPIQDFFTNPERMPIAIFFGSFLPLLALLHPHGWIFLLAFVFLIYLESTFLGKKYLHFSVFISYSIWMMFGLWIAATA